MKFHLKNSAIFILVFSAAFQTFSAEKNSAKEILSIDFALNTKNEDKKNHLNWSNSSKKIHDFYDAASGASVSHSTGELFSAFHTANQKNLLAPKGLRHLLLFAVSNPESLKSENLEVLQDDDGKITIKFTHRKIKYFIRTNEKGIIDVENDFFIAENSENQTSENQNSKNQNDRILENESAPDKKNSAPKNENQKSQNDEELKKLEKSEFPKENLESQKSQGKKIPENLAAKGFDFDKADAGEKYTGKLKAAFKNGILRISGKLKLLENLQSNNE